jgi:protein-glutamine gamma-glutamyltransferase
MASAAASTASPGATPLPAVQRYFEVSLFLLVATGILSIVSTGKLDLLSVLIPSVALIYKGVRLQRGRGPEISPRAATWLVLCYFLFFPLDLWVLSRGLAEGAPNPPLYAALLSSIHLIMFATLVRLYSARSNRDHAFLAVLAVASMLVSAILTVETGFLIALAIFLVLSVSTFVALEMKRSAAGAVSPPFENGSPTSRRLNRALGFTSLLVASSVLAIGVVLFFFIPRFSTGYLSSLSLQPGLLTGFSDSVTLGQIGEIKKNPAVVMRIKVDGDPGRAADMHWRGIVLTTFTGTTWTTPKTNDFVLEPNVSGEYFFGEPPRPTDRFNLLRYTVLMEPIATDAIFIAPPVETLRGKFGLEGVPPAGASSHGFLLAPGQAASHGYLFMDRTGSLFNPTHNNTKIRYEGTARLPIISADELRKASTDYPEEIGEPYLQLPASLDPRIKKLAEDVTARSASEYDKAAELRRYLIAHYSYTLNLTAPTGRGADPLAYFLFVRRAGHCEYFATAMTVMLRTIGIPARYVTGFLPGEYNDVGGDYIIRGSDAHAWVEVYFNGYGWITFDPTPPSSEEHGFLGRFGLYWDWFQLTWNEWVINYDFAHQLTLGRNMHDSTRNWNERIRAFYRREEKALLARVLALDKRTEASPYFLPGVLVCLIALLLALRGQSMIRYLVARWSLRARRSGDLTASLAALEYTEMLRLLEKRGWKKAASQTPLEFAAAIPAADILAPVLQLTEMYQSARFGDHPAPIEQMSALLRSIRDSLRTRKPSQT